jgi:uncharacterized protein (TIGR02996 family)
MTDGDALLRAVLLDPACDTARLVYTDWLEENGQHERAVWLRAAVREKLGPFVFPPGTPAVFAVLCGESGDWDMMGRPSAVKLADAIPGVSYTVSRGFVSAVTCTQADFLAHAASIFAAHPVERVTITGTEPEQINQFPGTSQWTFFVGDAAVEGGSRRHIAHRLWVHIKRSWYPTRAAADAALSAACVAYGRALAGLPADLSVVGDSSAG